MAVIARALGVSRAHLYAMRERLKTEHVPAGDSHASCRDDAALVLQIRFIAAVRSTCGYRLIAAVLRRMGYYRVNHKKVYRVMKAAKLSLQRHTGRTSRTHTGKVITLRSNTRWCTDAFGIQCWNGEQLQVAFSMDCCDRKVISWVTSSRGFDGELVRDLMTKTLEKRFPGLRTAPNSLQWLSDNGPGYTARQTVFHGRALGLEICTTPSYSPRSNGMAEAFVKTFRRDYVYVSDLTSADAVRGQLTAWFDYYNQNAPHKGLRMLSPREYLAREK